MVVLEVGTVAATVTEKEGLGEEESGEALAAATAVASSAARA